MVQRATQHFPRDMSAIQHSDTANEIMLNCIRGAGSHASGVVGALQLPNHTQALV